MPLCLLGCSCSRQHLWCVILATVAALSSGAVVVVLLVVFADVPLDDDIAIAVGMPTGVISVVVVAVRIAEGAVGRSPMGVPVTVSFICRLRRSVACQRAGHLVEREMAVELAV
jgi:hypothetical protein